jgi:hypothetical protein
MRFKNLYLLLILLVVSWMTNAQTKRVLLEEYTGTACGNCPMGGYMMDSMLAKYPGLIAVSLHAFPPHDAMNFSQIDTIYPFYSGGVPCGAIDRILWPGSKPVVARQLDSWDTIIRNRLLATPKLTVSLTAVWNKATRIASGQVKVDILSDLPAGDYRINLYVVEDSITGTGTGYDQLNYYNKTVGNPFYGKGDYIIGYVHRHVTRALLPSPWGLAGLIPSGALTGQTYSQTFNYTMPVYNKEQRTKLVALVYRASAGHQADEVLNADEKDLVSVPTGLSMDKTYNNQVKIYPNPANDRLFISLSDKSKNSECNVRITDALGKVVLLKQLELSSQTAFIGIDQLPVGMYMVNVFSGNRIFGSQILMIIR